MAEPVTNVVYRIVLLGAEHTPGDRVAECVSCDVARFTASG